MVAPKATLNTDAEDAMTKMAGGILLMIALCVCWMLVGGAAAATPISACGTTISAPGSYVLTSNLSSPNNNNCITVAANGVTIDFSGFVIDGAGGGAGVTDDGADRKSIVVRNGTIRGKGAGGGIILLSRDVVVDGMILAGNREGVVLLQGVVRSSTIYDNADIGVQFSNSSSVV